MKILCVSVPAAALNAVRAHTQDAALEIIDTPAGWDALFSADNLSFAAVLCGPQPPGMPPTEVAQSCATLLPDSPVFFVSYSSENLATRDLVKNGFKQVFLLPGDDSLFAETLATIERQSTGKGKVVHRAVSLIDVEPGEPLDFEVSIYLRINKKYVRIINEGKSLDRAKIDKFKNYQVDRVYIDATKMDRFYKYTADKLRRLNHTQTGVSETERIEKMRSTLRKILHTVFDTSTEASFEEGRKIFEDTSKAINEMIGTSAATNLQRELSKTLAQPPEESARAGRVSTFAALFEMAMGLKQTQQAAIAGLFLDIGLAQMPPELQTKPREKMTPQEREIYDAHPVRAVALLQARRMAVPTEVQAAIQHHHERHDGAGYPGRLPGHKIPMLSYVVAAADRFESLVFGEQPMSAEAALDFMRRDRGYSPEVLAAIQSLVVTPAKAA